MNNRWLVAIAVVSFLLNILMVSIGLGGNAIGQSSLITVPPLTKDTGYFLIVPNNNTTCVDIELKLGLQRGDVESISNDPRIGTIITFKKGVLLDSAKVQAAADRVKGLIPNIQVK
jgi:hypothetical protein